MKNAIIFLAAIMIAGCIYAQEIHTTDKLPEVVQVGSGEINMILIPCMNCRWNEWEEFMDRNKEKYKMWAVTIPGYGGTPYLDLPMNTETTPWRDTAIAGLSELIDQHELEKVVVVGHSWGTMLAVQLAAIRKDVVTKVIAVDGSIESTTWTPNTQEERIEQANQVIANYSEKLKNAEEWSKFNGASIGLALGNKDSITMETMQYRIKLLTSFMATDRQAMLQYWRENSLIDLTAYLHQLEIPILDIQSFAGGNQSKQKEQYLATLTESNAPPNVQYVIMYDTKHFIMYHRPLKLDCIINDFIQDKELVDFAPENSEYFEEEKMN